jgi:hypothetical protein
LWKFLSFPLVRLRRACRESSFISSPLSIKSSLPFFAKEGYFRVNDVIPARIIVGINSSWGLLDFHKILCEPKAHDGLLQMLCQLAWIIHKNY